MNTPNNSEALPPTTGSPSSDLGYDAELTTAQLHAQWVAKYEQVQELWNIDNCQKNDRIEALETALRELVKLEDNDRRDHAEWMTAIDDARSLLPENDQVQATPPAGQSADNISPTLTYGN